MARHTFSFNGGEELTTMGASWFVSYCYYQKLDRTHKNWNNVTTVTGRISVFNNTTKVHNYWLEQVQHMKDGNLNKNTLGLRAIDIKNMASKLL